MRINERSIKSLFVILFVMVCLLSFNVNILEASVRVSDETLIKQAIANLVSGNAQQKQAAIATLNSHGEAIIPLLVDIMKSHRGEENFTGYEIVIYGESFKENGLPIFAQGLYDENPNTRNRAAKAIFELGAKAESVVNDVAMVAGNQSEINSVRSQAIDALRKIGVVNSEVTHALAVSLAANDAMMVWKTNQAITALKLSFDDLVPILFDELAAKRNIHSSLTAISGNLDKMTDPIGMLASEFEQPSEMVQNHLWTLIDGLYPRMSRYTNELSELLISVAKTQSGTMKAQAIYALGELTKYDQGIITQLLTMVQNPDITDEDYLLLVLALEKTAPNNPEVISFLIDVLTDGKSDAQAQLGAARYLENCTDVPQEDIFALLSVLNKLDESVLWRISPVIYQGAQKSDQIVARLYQIVETESDLVLEFVHNVLSALGDEAGKKSEIIYSEKSGERTPAFPTAEGYGRYTVGGRGGDVYIVTNLNDSGPGSLRAAIDASGPRTIVFAVSGNIMLKTGLNINNPYITIAGQTAPGDGITVAGGPLVIGADQVIIRYLRFRLGDYNNFEADAIDGRGISDVIIDHVSASWAIDETVSLYLTENVTLQWSFVTESLRGSLHAKGNHGYGGIWSDYSSFHHNLLAHHSSRNPRIGGQEDRAVDLRNNVIYNWGFNSTYGGEGALVNLVANYYKPGPGTGSGRVNHRIVEISNGGKWYVADNFVYGYPEITADNWAGGAQPRLDRIEDVRHGSEHPVPHVTTHSAEEAFELVLANAGATLPVRDAIDQRIAEEVRTGTAIYGGLVSGLDSGIIDSQDDVGGLTFLRSYSMPLDSDQDGIPDWWAIKYGFNPAEGLDHAGDLDGDGYTNLEEYLNGTNPLVAND